MAQAQEGFDKLIQDSLVAQPDGADDALEQPAVKIGGFEFIMYKGDATKQEACEKRKMHLSILHLSICSMAMLLSGVQIISGMNADATPEEMASCFRGLQELLPCIRSVPAMQAVIYGTGEELYRLVLAEFQSTGVRTWEDKLNDQACAGHLRLGQPAILRFYAFGFDKGSDNQAFVKRIKQRLSGQPFFLFWVIWCMYHQYHLIVASVLGVIESWDWSDAVRLLSEGETLPADRQASSSTRYLSTNS